MLNHRCAGEARSSLFLDECDFTRAHGPVLFIALGLELALDGPGVWVGGVFHIAANLANLERASFPSPGNKHLEKKWERIHFYHNWCSKACL